MMLLSTNVLQIYLYCNLNILYYCLNLLLSIYLYKKKHARNFNFSFIQEFMQNQLRRDITNDILAGLRYEEVVIEEEAHDEHDPDDNQVEAAVEEIQRSPPAIDIHTGNFLIPIPTFPPWTYWNPMCSSYPVFADRFHNLANLSPQEVQYQLAGRDSMNHALGGIGYEARPNVKIECQVNEPFPRAPDLFESYFPSFDFKGLNHLPYHFLVKDGSEPLGSVVLPTNIPFTFPRVPLPDNVTLSGVRKSSLADYVKGMMAGRSADPRMFDTDGVIKVVKDLVYKPHGDIKGGRALPIGNAGSGWTVESLVVGLGNRSWNLKIVLPPLKPVACLVGASHVDRMSKLDFDVFDEVEGNPKTTHPHYLLWTSTAFIVTNGHFEPFNSVKTEIFAFFFSKVKAKYIGKIAPSDHLRFVLMPFTWDILSVPVEKQTWNLIKISRFLTEIKRSTDYMQISHVYSEVPLLHNDQDYCIRTNIVVREVNYLINSSHVPVRIWYLRMAPSNCARAERKVTITGWNRGLHLVKELDRTHLTQHGYFEWICEVWNRAILESNPPELAQLTWRDFDPMNLLIVPNLGTATSYFDELVKADVKARLDRTDITAASRLSLMQSLRVDLTRLDRAYHWRVPRVNVKHFD